MPETRPSTRVTFPLTQTGVASGMNANIRTIGGAIGTALVSSVITVVAISPLVPGGRRGERRWLRTPATAEAR